MSFRLDRPRDEGRHKTPWRVRSPGTPRWFTCVTAMADPRGRPLAARPSRSLSCSSPASSTVYGGSRSTVTCAGGRRWMCGNVGQRTPVAAWQAGMVQERMSGGGWDFFVSYAQPDRAWAEWIAWQLEEGGYRVLIQAWDMVPGADWA